MLERGDLLQLDIYRFQSICEWLQTVLFGILRPPGDAMDTRHKVWMTSV